MSANAPAPEDPRDLVIRQTAETLERLLQIALFMSGADLARRGGVIPRTAADVNAVAASTEPVTLLAANGNRKGACIYNDSASPLVVYVKFGEGASADDFTVKLAQDDYYELPANYRGEVSAVWSDSGSGFARVTEYAW